MANIYTHGNRRVSEERAMQLRDQKRKRIDAAKAVADRRLANAKWAAAWNKHQGNIATVETWHENNGSIDQEIG